MQSKGLTVFEVMRLSRRARKHIAKINGVAMIKGINQPYVKRSPEENESDGK